MDLKEMHDEHVHGNHPADGNWSWRYASISMKWYGWGSPVGLSIFFVALCVCALLVKFAWTFN